MRLRPEINGNYLSATGDTDKAAAAFLLSFSLFHSLAKTKVPAFLPSGSRLFLCHALCALAAAAIIYVPRRASLDCKCIAGNAIISHVLKEDKKVEPVFMLLGRRQHKSMISFTPQSLLFLFSQIIIVISMVFLLRLNNCNSTSDFQKVDRPISILLKQPLPPCF